MADIVCPQVNYPDFNIYDLLIVLKTYSPTCLDEFENLRSFIERFEVCFHNFSMIAGEYAGMKSDMPAFCVFQNLKEIKAYMNSSEYLHRPFTNTMAHWGYYFD